MKKQPMKTPVIATCIRTGTEYRFPSMAATAEDGYMPGKVRDCVRGRAKTHLGMTWKADGPLRPIKTTSGAHRAAVLRQKGRNNEEIAAALGVTVSTAKLYILQGSMLGLCATVGASNNGRA